VYRGECMKKVRIIKTYNLSHSVVEELNKTVRPRYRSKWVEEAIEDKLSRKANFELHDFKTTELLSHIRNTRFTKLTQLEKTLIDDMRDRLAEMGE